jgi:hypothetical protein
VFDFPYLKIGRYVMKVYQVNVWMIAVALVLLADTSASQAGWFRGGGRCYYYTVDSTYTAATSSAPTATPAPTAAPTPMVAAAPTGPVVHQANMPVIGMESAPVAAPATIYAPSTAPGGGWSVTPRSSWDFGRFPPFR